MVVSMPPLYVAILVIAIGQVDKECCTWLNGATSSLNYSAMCPNVYRNAILCLNELHHNKCFQE